MKEHLGGQACTCKLRIWCHEWGGFTLVPPLNHPPIAPLHHVSSYILWRGLYYRNVWSCPLLLRTLSAPITAHFHPDRTSTKTSQSATSSLAMTGHWGRVNMLRDSSLKGSPIMKEHSAFATWCEWKINLFSDYSLIKGFAICLGDVKLVTALTTKL